VAGLPHHEIIVAWGPNGNQDVAGTPQSLRFCDANVYAITDLGGKMVSILTIRMVKLTLIVS